MPARFNLTAKALLRTLLWGLALIILTACGPAVKEWEPSKAKTRVSSVAFRQLPPEPVYNTVRWVHLPEPLPSRELPLSDAPQIRPVFHMQLKNVTLEEAAHLLAASVRYGSYCASSIAKKRVSINALGTTDELAAQIASQARVDIYVDHVNQQVRVLARQPLSLSPQQPSFLRSGQAETQYVKDGR